MLIVLIAREHDSDGESAWTQTSGWSRLESWNEHTWKPITQACFVPSLDHIDPEVLEKRNMWKVCIQTNARTDNSWSARLAGVVSSGKLIVFNSMTFNFEKDMIQTIYYPLNFIIEIIYSLTDSPPPKNINPLKTKNCGMIYLFPTSYRRKTTGYYNFSWKMIKINISWKIDTSRDFTFPE